LDIIKKDTVIIADSNSVFSIKTVKELFKNEATLAWGKPLALFFVWVDEGRGVGYYGEGEGHLFVVVEKSENLD
jgi:hypothetical protein